MRLSRVAPRRQPLGHRRQRLLLLVRVGDGAGQGLGLLVLDGFGQRPATAASARACPYLPVMEAARASARRSAYLFPACAAAYAAAVGSLNPRAPGVTSKSPAAAPAGR